MTHYRRRRRGSVYIAVLAAAMIVTIVGLSALLATRIQGRSAGAMNRAMNARFYARSAIEMGLYLVHQDPNWRADRVNGTSIAKQSIGSGTFSLEAIDPQDGDLSDSVSDLLVLTGTGIDGQARHKMQVTLEPVLRPLEALKTCLCAAGQILVTSGQSLAAMEGPVCTNANLIVDGTIYGAVEAQSVSGTGTVVGTVTAPAPPKQMPAPDVFERYQAMATVLPSRDKIENMVISPSHNPIGPTNPDGLYFIDTNGRDLTITGVRINGTLVVRCPGQKVILDSAVFLHNYRPYYPTLIVEGNLEIKIQSKDYNLSEAAWATSFNPPGAPYLGQSDGDQMDEFPNEVRGLVHVKGTVLMSQPALIRGTIICESTVTCDDHVQMLYDPSLFTTPPLGYTAVVGMRIAPGTWRQAVD